MATQTTTDAVTAYAEAVLADQTPAGQLVKLACARHLRDLEAGEDRGLVFDRAAAQRAIDFFGFLKQSKGEWAGQSLTLEPWQAFIVGSIFGWKRADGLRRFRTVYIEVPRKNGKSTLSAGVGLYLLVADGEPGAEIYTAATKRDQARIVHGEAVAMVKASPALSGRVAALKDNLNIVATRSKYEPLGADADSMDGLNVHGAIIDELHAHKTRNLWDVIETATGARRQPLIWAITTAGWDRHSICWEVHDYGAKILSNVIHDDTLFAYVASVDEADDWRDERVWAKANPNLGVSVKLDDLQRKAEKAKELPSAQNAFKQLHLDIWTEQAKRWLNLSVWDACEERERPNLAHQPCYGGLDLSSTTDLSAFALLFPRDDGIVDVTVHFWLPEESLRRRVERDRVPYDVWAQAGYITLTPGNVIDYDWIRAEIQRDAERYQINEIGFDPYNATQIVTQLQGDGLELVPVRQGFLSLSPPTKEMEKRILGKTIRHDGNPVLRWMISNVAIDQDPAGNIKPAKDKSTERIDGVVAMIIALDRLARGDNGRSVYDERGILAL